LKTRKEEEFMRLAEKNPQLKKAVSRLVELSEDDQTRLLAESREKLQRDIVAREHAAEEKGRGEGREEAQFAIARKALAEGLPLETVMAITGLSFDAIRVLH
jgi:predicted transposase/invertase (TIGR01784 family)